MRKGNQNKIAHAVATSMVYDRVSNSHLPDTGPQKQLTESDFFETFQLNEEENLAIRDRYRILIPQIIIN